jgi:hypothetical protein
LSTSPLVLIMNSHIDEVYLLDLYRSSVPSEFDRGLIQIQQKLQSEYDEKLKNSPMRKAFAKCALTGNSHRCELENNIMDLAEDLRMNAQIFRSRGGSPHAKLVTEHVVVTFHSLGDGEKGLSRYSEYKKALSRGNSGDIFRNGAHTRHVQGSFWDLSDADSFVDNLSPRFDEKIYFTVCIPRVFHVRHDVNIIVPDSEYMNSILEFKLSEIRDYSKTEGNVEIHRENKIKPDIKRVKIRREIEENDIQPKREISKADETKRDEDAQGG